MEQKIAKAIGDSGCYFLCLLKACNKEDNAIGYYKKYVAAGLMEEDCFIKKPVAILSDLTGQSYQVLKSIAPDEAASILVARFHNPKTGLYHFVLVDSNGSVIWDPYGTSNTVANGYIESYRLFYKR